MSVDEIEALDRVHFSEIFAPTEPKAGFTWTRHARQAARLASIHLASASKGGGAALTASAIFQYQLF